MKPTLQAALEWMLAELEGNQLMIALVPARREANTGAMIRVACAKNAKWYSDFCTRHLSSRERRRALPDTRIKRRNTVRALNQLLTHTPAGKYGPELTKIAKAMLEKMRGAA